MHNHPSVPTTPYIFFASPRHSGHHRSQQTLSFSHSRRVHNRDKAGDTCAARKFAEDNVIATSLLARLSSRALLLRQHSDSIAAPRNYDDFRNSRGSCVISEAGCLYIYVYAF